MDRLLPRPTHAASSPIARHPARPQPPESATNDDLGHSDRQAKRSRPGVDAAQGHHQQGLPGASGAVSRPAAEGHQPLQQLRLPEPRLLCLAAGQLARASRHPDGRDHHRSLRAQALRERAARTGAGAQQMPQGSRRLVPGEGVVLLRHRTRRRPGTVSPSCCSTGSARRRWKWRSATTRNGPRSARSASCR